MAKDMLDAIYNAEEECKQREMRARAISAEKIEQTKTKAEQVVLSAKEQSHKNADILFEKAVNESKKELQQTRDKAKIDCEILSQTAEKNRSRVICEAIKMLSH